MTAYGTDDREGRLVAEAIETLRSAGRRAPDLCGVPTGVEGLDELFYVTRLEGGVPKTVPLGGYPAGAVIQVTGVPDTGKTLLAEQFAVRQAALGRPVCFVTVEVPATYLVAGLRARAEAMGADADAVADRVVVVDAASHAVLREDLPSLLRTLAHAIRAHGIQCCVVDSVTGLYEAREIQARQVVRQLFQFMKAWRQTALFVAQKRSGHEELTAEAAGGYAVSHIVDGSIVLAKVLVRTPSEARLYGRPPGDVARLLRIDGCRLCGHSTRTHRLEIAPTGLVRVGPPLGADEPAAEPAVRAAPGRVLAGEA